MYIYFNFVLFTFQTVDLKPGGSRIEVTNTNKLDYIQKLAEWRLSESVKEEVHQFLKGKICTQSIVCKLWSFLYGSCCGNLV